MDFFNNCQQCNSEFSDEKAPFLLQCGHCLCQQCLDQAKQEQVQIKCQICKEKSDPKSSLKHLQLLALLNNKPCYLCSKHAQQKTEIIFKCISDQELCCSLCLQGHAGHYSQVQAYTSDELLTDIKVFMKKLECGQKFLQNQFLNLQAILDKRIKYSKEIKEIILEAEKLLTKPLFPISEFQNIKFPLNCSQISCNLKTELLKNADEKQFIEDLFDKHIQLRRIFNGSIDGFSSNKFHQICDTKRQILIIVESEHHQKFGGYLDRACNSKGSYIKSHNSFLFSLTKKQKLPIVKKFEEAFYGTSDKGPTFGGGFDLKISSYCHQNNDSLTNLGYSYFLPYGISYGSSEAKNYLAGSYKFKVLNYEAFLVEFV